jgi:hypothetical protein
MRRAQETCRLRRISPSVQLVEYAKDGRSRINVQGVHTCKSPLCPLCAPKWQRVRAEEVGTAMTKWPRNRLAFASLTMRHHRFQSLHIQHRLLRDAYGHMWSGRAGQAFRELLGGKPESIRAHDRTWSREHGWHPHLHAVLFLKREGLSETELRSALLDRWRDCLRAGLRRFVRLSKRILAGKPCRDPVCPVCTGAGPVLTAEQVRAHDLGCNGRLCPELGKGCPVCDVPISTRLFPDECPTLRERATRVFGAKLIKRRVPLRDGVRQVAILLRQFSEVSIAPGDEDPAAEAFERHGVDVQYVRAADLVADYVVKLGVGFFERAGLELAGAGKLGKLGTDGIQHFGQWEVARLVASHGHPLRDEARRAWKHLHDATWGTQTLTISNRDALGLGPDPYADGNEPAEQATDETTRCLGEIDARAWDPLSRARKHELLAELATAHENGVLAGVPFLRPPPDPTHAEPVARPPPQTGPPREERERRRQERLLEAQRRGAAIFGGALRKNTENETDNSLFREELCHRLDLVLGRDA